MRTAFHILFSIQVLHEYFENEICNCLVFTPTQQTLLLINKYQFKINQSNNGFSLYSSNCNTTDYLNYITSKTDTNYFEFDVTTTNSNFNSFTDVPTDIIGQFLFSSQQVIIKANTFVLENNYSTTTSTNKVGTIKIYFEDIIKLLDSQMTINYEIHFDARATQWCYYIINENHLSLTNPEIASKHNISFEQAKTVTIENGKQALLFSSGKNLIKMSNNAKYKFDLVDKSVKTNQTGKVIFKGLPNPNPKYIGIEMEGEDKTITSPMYVYI